MKLETAEPIVTKGRTATAVNPFLEQAPKLLEMTADGKSVRITLDEGQKPYAVIDQIRKAANSVDKGLSVAFDPADDTDEKRKLAKTFRFTFTKRITRTRKPKEGEATETPTEPTPEAPAEPTTKPKAARK